MGCTFDCKVKYLGGFRGIAPTNKYVMLHGRHNAYLAMFLGFAFKDIFQKKEGENMADKTRSVKKTFRLMPIEAEGLAKRANELSMNESEYLRLLLSQKPSDYPEIRILMKQLVNEVNHIGVNINQIVHNNNSMLYSKTDKEVLTAYMISVNRLLREVVGILV